METATLILLIVGGGFALPAVVLTGQEVFTTEVRSAASRMINAFLACFYVGYFAFAMYYVISRGSQLV